MKVRRWNENRAEGEASATARPQRSEDSLSERMRAPALEAIRKAKIERKQSFCMHRMQIIHRKEGLFRTVHRRSIERLVDLASNARVKMSNAHA